MCCELISEVSSALVFLGILAYQPADLRLAPSRFQREALDADCFAVNELFVGRKLQHEPEDFLKDNLHQTGERNGRSRQARRETRVVR